MMQQQLPSGTLPEDQANEMDELKQADDLLSKADALLQKHASPPAAAVMVDDLPILTDIVEQHDEVCEDDFDIDFSKTRLLTSDMAEARVTQFSTDLTGLWMGKTQQNVVEEAVQADAFVSGASALPTADVPSAGRQASLTASPVSASTQMLVEKVLSLETTLTRLVDEWFARELPKIIEREIKYLPVRIREEALTHMHVTLFSQVSEEIAQQIGDIIALEKKADAGGKEEAAPPAEG